MAVRTVSNTGGNWNATTTWVGGVVPSATLDTVAFTATSGQLTVNVASVCIGINFTNYVNTITFTALLTVNGPINLGTGGYTQAGGSGIQANATATHTSNGVVWSRLWAFAGVSQTYTLADNFNFTGSLNFNGVTSIIINGNTINTRNILSTTTAITSGTTNIVFNGTGTWSNTSTGAIRNNVTVNTASTLTLGANVYWNTGIFTHLSGNVDTTTNASTFNCQSGTIDAANVTWNNFYFSSTGANILVLLNTLNILRDFTVGGQGTITGAFDIYCGNNNVNNSSSGATNVTLNHSGIIYCSNNLTYSGATNTCRHSGTVYVGGSVAFNAPAIATQGPTNLYMVGNGTMSALSLSYPILSNIYFNTSGKIKITTALGLTVAGAKIINLIRGIIDASKCDLYLSGNVNHTLTNMHKIAWKSINLLGTTTVLTMNEFFSGKPDLKTVIASTVASNYTITFTDNFEKIGKFVTITNCTLSRPQQLLVITNSKKSSTNKGIRYINQSPNGIAKDNPSTQTQVTYNSNTSMLLSDPAMK